MNYINGDYKIYSPMLVMNEELYNRLQIEYTIDAEVENIYFNPSAPYEKLFTYVRAKGKFINGKREGPWKFFYPDRNLQPKLVLDVNYSKGIKDGKYVSYNLSNSSIKSKRYYFYDESYVVYIDLKRPSFLNIDGTSSKFYEWMKKVERYSSSQYFPDRDKLKELISMARLYSLQLRK